MPRSLSARTSTVIGLVLATLLVGGLLRAASPPGAAPLDDATHAGAWRDIPLGSAVLDRWDTRDGLRQVTVQAMAQDPSGILWVGTQFGLTRFDGLRFDDFLPQQHPALPSPNTTALLEADGDLYIGTALGLVVRSGTTFHSVAMEPQAQAGTTVHALARCDDGRVWAATSLGLFAGDAERMVPMHPLRNPFHSVHCEGNVVRAGSEHHIHEYVDHGWLKHTLPEAYQDTRITAILPSTEGLWVGTSRGLVLRSELDWLPIDGAGLSESTPISSLKENADGQVLAGGAQGLTRIVGRQPMETLDYHGTEPLSEVRTILLDREANLWLGTTSTGLVRLTKRTLQVTPIPLTTPGVVTWSVTAETGRPDPGLWVGTNAGVFLLRDGHFRQLLKASALPHPDAYNMLAEQGRLWIGTRAGLVYVDDPLGSAQANIRHDPRLQPLDSHQIHALLRDHQGRFWIGATNGLWELQEDRLVHWQGPELLDETLGVTYLLESSAGALLIGTSDGAFRMHNGRISRIELPDIAEPTWVDAIGELPDGTLAFGLRGGRILLKQGNQIRNFRQPGALAESTPFHMVAFEDHLWIVSINGIARYPLAQLRDYMQDETRQPDIEIVVSSPRNHHALTQGACCNGAGTSKAELLGGTLYMPGRGGVFSVTPSELGIGNQKPTPLITRLVTTQDRIEQPADQPYRLERGVRGVTFEFTLVSLRNPGARSLRYRLLGFDQTWRDAEVGQYQAQYTNLPPGEYRFQVSGTSATGVPADAVASTIIIIPPYFSETAWFWVLLAAIGSGLFALGYRLLGRMHRRREAQLDRMIHERTRELQEANKELERISTTDALTGLHNRRHITALMAQEMAYYARYFAARPDLDESMVFCILDLDDFKLVNDSLGHEAGDRLLRSFAHQLRSSMREGDHLARWGGEEFLVVLRPMPAVQVPALLDRMCKTIREARHDIGTDAPVKVTCSIGATEFPRIHAPWQTLLVFADYAMYRAKEAGRDNWALLRPARAGNQSFTQTPGNLERMLADGRLQLLRGDGGAEPAASADPLVL